MNARDVVSTKRDGGALDDAQIDWFLRGYVAGEIPDYQASALLMAIYVHGMSDAELEAWTRAMLASGTRYDLSRLERRRADKHSTGGVGDKVSIPLAPAVAACGVAVPMISGRGLGHTGGTLDKLESIPGLRTDLSADELRRLVEELGFAFAGQTDDVVPADKKLYALRDVTGLVASTPLIASSILSKKLAEDVEALVLDVKFGTGAFLTDRARGAELARTMVRLAGRMGLAATAYQTCMDRPLGRTVGHAIEIAESLDCMRGAGPPDLRELVCLLGGEMLAMVGVVPGPDAGHDRIAAVLDDGAALELFQRGVERQGGDPACCEDPSRLPQAPDRATWRAPRAGTMFYADVRELGLAVSALGGGRLALGAPIDPAVGLRMIRRAGEDLREGEAVVELSHRGGRGLDEALEHVGRAIGFGPPTELAPLVLARIEARPEGR